MRYRFRGLIRDSGKPVEGHVEAEVEEEAFNALSESGIVTESLRPDPKPLNMAPGRPELPEFADALDSAFDSSATQIPFDSLQSRFRGKSVWVIDRDKIRRRVAQVVDAAIAQSQLRGEGNVQARARVAHAIEGLFGDNRNLTSPVSQNAALEEQINRLANFIKTAEGVLQSIKTAALTARPVYYAEGGGGGRRHRKYVRDDRPDEVLMEIFKTNLELRGKSTAHLPTKAAAGAAAGSVPPSDDTPGASGEGAAPAA